MFAFSGLTCFHSGLHIVLEVGQSEEFLISLGLGKSSRLNPGLSARDNSRYTCYRNSTLLSYRRVLIAEVLMAASRGAIVSMLSLSVLLRLL